MQCPRSDSSVIFRGVDPYGTGGRVPPIFGLGGQYIMNVHPNILRVTSVTFHPCTMIVVSLGYEVVPKCQIWQICGYQGRFFQPPNTPKLVFGRGSAPDSAGGAYDAPPDPLVGWGGGHPSPFPYPLDAFGVSISAPSAPRLSGPQLKFLATPMGSGGLVYPPQPWREIDAYGHFGHNNRYYNWVLTVFFILIIIIVILLHERTWE